VYIGSSRLRYRIRGACPISDSNATTSTDSDLATIADFPALALALSEVTEICERLEAAGYPSASLLSSALTGGERLPDLVDYVEQVTEQARIAEICGWDLGAARWWSHRVEYMATIDEIRAELSNEPGHLAAFESFNNDFEAAYPTLAQSLSIAIDCTHNEYWEEAGREALQERQPELEAALGKVASERRLARA
jgi:hypothetical protein